jgi:hypothetical protein
MLRDGAIQRALENLTEDWEDVDLDVRDFLLAGCVRDGVKLEVSERDRHRWVVCGEKQNVLAAVGEHLSRIHKLRVSAREYDPVLAAEQTRLLLRVNRSIHEYIAMCETLGIDWSDDLHELMRTRAGPAPAESTTDVFDIHLCTNVPCVDEAVDVVHDNLQELRCYFGDRLGQFLRGAFGEDEQESAIEYIEELIITGVYIGPVAESEAETPEWAFHLKGRALQNAHAEFGDERVASDDRYLYI